MKLVSRSLNSHSTDHICFIILYHKKDLEIEEMEQRKHFKTHVFFLLCPSFAESYQYLTSQLVNTTEGARLLSYLEASFRGQER
jgi:hypothetical protein